MNNAYAEPQHSKEAHRPIYSANNPYAYAEQYLHKYPAGPGHFENGVYIAGEENLYATFAQDANKQHSHFDGTTRAPRQGHKTGGPRGILPPIMKSEHLCISDLHWWTAHHHILQACQQAGVSLARDAITSAEHKVNGKSKGCVYLTCRTSDDAQKIGAWFRDHDFQGKKMPTAFASKDAIRALKTPAASMYKASGQADGTVSSNPRPASGSLTSLANHPPTNAHGGINFNRLRQHNRNYGTNSAVGTTSVPGRAQKAGDPATLQTWQQPNMWPTDGYQGAPVYLPGVHGMLPFMQPIDPSLFGMQGEHHYQ